MKDYLFPINPEVRKPLLNQVEIQNPYLNVKITNPVLPPKEVNSTIVNTPHVEVDNLPERLNVSVDNFPTNQPITVDNFPTNQKVTVENAINIANLPLGEQNTPGKADPYKYITVRITDGKNFVRPTDKISGGGDGGGIGSTIGNHVITSQVIAASTPTSLANSNTRIMNGVIVRALDSNTGTVYIGGPNVTTTTGFSIDAGESTSLAINNLDAVFVIGNGSDGVCFITTN